MDSSRSTGTLGTVSASCEFGGDANTNKKPEPFLTTGPELGTGAEGTGRSTHASGYRQALLVARRLKDKGKQLATKVFARTGLCCAEIPRQTPTGHLKQCYLAETSDDRRQPFIFRPLRMEDPRD